MDTSSKLFSKVISFFSSEASTYSKSTTEDFSEVRIIAKQLVLQIPDLCAYISIIEEINNWDSIHISVRQEGEILANFTNRNSESFEDIISVIDVTLGSHIELIFTIEKNSKNDVLSIYFLNRFIEYLESLSFYVFIGILEKQINEKRIIFYNSEFEESFFLTQSIFISNKVGDTNNEIISRSLRVERKKMATSLCHWELQLDSLLPEDLFPIVENKIEQSLIEIFKKASILYTSMFFFDYINLKSDYLIYKLNGYRTFNEKVNVSRINQIDISSTSYKLTQVSHPL